MTAGMVRDSQLLQSLQTFVFDVDGIPEDPFAGTISQSRVS